MMNGILQEAAKSFWRELGQQAVKQFVGALMAEGVKASIEVLKHERLERQKRRLNKEFKAEDDSQTVKVAAPAPAKEPAPADEVRADDPPTAPPVEDAPRPPDQPVVFVFDLP
jgi:hypothetical protein